jgi:hypothetical protein
MERYTSIETIYSCITITSLDIIHRPIFYLKHNISETGFCPRFQEETTQMGPVYRASLCLRRQRLMIVILIYLRHKPIDLIYSWFENYPRLTFGCSRLTLEGSLELTIPVSLAYTYDSLFMVQTISHSTMNNVCNWSCDIN